MFHVVLVEPEIPPNTGNVARLCAATHSQLHLVGPLGFQLDDRQLKRAGMDYWQQVQWHYHENFGALLKTVPSTAHLYCIETIGNENYDSVSYQPGDYLIFGRETKGLRTTDIMKSGGKCLRIPLLNPEARSLNLANCVAVVLFEALRQKRFIFSK